MSTQHIAHYHSPVGLLEITADNKGLTGIRLLSQPKGLTESTNPIIKETIKQLAEYFQGDRKEFSIPLSFGGTDFQRSVWEALLQIPYGKTTTYSQVAVSIDRPKAIRAAGTAIGKNPIPIIIPCHRVIATNGGLGGFAWGLEVKKKLLDREQ